MTEYKMVGVRVYKTDEVYKGRFREVLQEFRTIRSAADFINNIAEEKLGKKFNCKYIEDIISGKRPYCESFFVQINIRTRRSNKCVKCGIEFYAFGIKDRCTSCVINANFDFSGLLTHE